MLLLSSSAERRQVTNQVITTRRLHDSLDNILFSGCRFTRHVDESWDTGTSSNGSDHVRIYNTVKQMTIHIISMLNFKISKITAKYRS